MKATLRKLGVAATVMLAPLALQAQTDNIVYGQTSIVFTPAFTQQLSSFGITVTDLTQTPLQNGTLTLSGVEGAIDLQTALGEVILSNGYQVVAQGTTIRVQDLVFSIINQTTAVISGIFIVNGQFVGRQTIFAVNKNPVGTVYTLPLQPRNGTLTFNGLSLGLSQEFVNLINNAMGQAVLNPGVQVATANAFSVVVPAPGR